MARSRKSHPLWCPVEVRGKRYPSVTAAAKAFGINPSSVSGYLSRNGHTEGLGLGYKSPARNQTPRHKKPVTIHGRRFDTIKSAADALGYGYAALWKALNTPMTPQKSDRLLAAVMAWEARQRRAA